MRLRRTRLTSVSALLLIGGTVLLTVFGVVDPALAQQCVPPPTGLVGWWAADGGTTDLTGHNQPGILEGDATFQPGKVQQAFALDGVTSWVNLGTGTGDFGAADFTIDLWVKFNTLNGEQIIIEKYVETFGTPSPPGWSMSKPSDRLFFGFGGAQQLNVQPVAAQTWNHVAVTRSGTTFKLYLNGVVRDTQTLNPSLTAPAAALKLGHRGAPNDTPGSLDTRGFYLSGLIDEVEIFNRALSDSEVQAIYNAGSAGKCKFITVAIDIKPGSYPNSINLASAGVVPVAILSSATFDATQVNPATVTLAGASVGLIGKGDTAACHIEDVNGDSLPDLVCQVVTAQFLIQPGDTVATLEADTFGGQRIQGLECPCRIRGQDTIRIVP